MPRSQWDPWPGGKSEKKKKKKKSIKQWEREADWKEKVYGQLKLNEKVGGLAGWVE